MADHEPETRIVIVRHGESNAQADGFLSGHDTCTGLSATGREQAAKLRERLLRTGELADVDAVYTSILPRAIETAEIIAPALGEKAPVQECEFCEIHPGESEGLSWDEFRQRYPTLDRGFDPYAKRGDGSESWAEFFARAGGRLARIRAEHPGEKVVVVGHGGIVGASFVALGNMAIKQAGAVTHEAVNSSITEWRYALGGWRLVRYNDYAHLSGLV